LNSAAGQLLQDDYDAFARQARLMTSIHAQIPENMKSAVKEARRRGDEDGEQIPEDEDERPAGPRTTSNTSSVVMKKRADHPRLSPNNSTEGSHATSGIGIGISSTGAMDNSDLTVLAQAEEDSDQEDAAAASKENDPSLSPSPVSPAPQSPRRNVLGKRPLSALPTPIDPDLTGDDVDDNDLMSPSEQNIANNVLQTPQQSQQSSAPARKSPKLSELSKGVNASGRIRDDVQIYEDNNTGEGKENLGSAGEKSMAVKKASNGTSAPQGSAAPKAAAARKFNGSISSGKNKARAGLRRL
jgi:ubiquitin-conjugating enzyme E2 S